jgi:hypothetical protein
MNPGACEAGRTRVIRFIIRSIQTHDLGVLEQVSITSVARPK